MKISVFFVGELHDNGFNASALAGAETIRGKNIHEVDIVSGVPYDERIMAERLSATAAASDFVIFVGGQGDKVTPQIADQFSHKRFAVVQGSVSGSNLVSYEVRQEESAFLAGILAAHYSQTGVVGHLSGHRVKPGLKGRAAYVAGAKFAKPDITVLTSFCGTQDDNDVTKIWADAQIAQDVDVIFTMLNGARLGVIEACRVASIHQIGNAMDWCKQHPDIFIGSAIAEIGAAVLKAVDHAEQGYLPSSKVEIGLKQGNAVTLSIGKDVNAQIRLTLADAERALKHDQIRIPDSYDGPEFRVPAL